MVRLNEVRPGELAVDLPAQTDAGVYFIGRIHTPWTNRLETPRQGRPDGPTCQIEVFAPWDKGLHSITEFERHTEIFQASHLWACQAIAALEAEGNRSITAILANSHPAAAR